MPYEITRGRISTWALEVPLVRHCNLRCEQCCTLSPNALPAQIEARDLERDLARAAEALSPHVLKLTGGEPLLHDDLAACVAVAKASGISTRVSMTTNGLLARQIPEAVWSALDRLTLSVYASVPLPDKTIRHIEAKCEQHGVLLTIKPIDAFQRMTPSAPLGPQERTAVYASCWLRHRCHTLWHGRFFKCTRPPALADTLGEARLASEGVSLEGGGLADRLLAYLCSPTPLSCCETCLGGSGDWLRHAQRPRASRGRGQPSK
jgi:hypothetical protein